MQMNNVKRLSKPKANATLSQPKGANNGRKSVPKPVQKNAHALRGSLGKKVQKEQPAPASIVELSS